MAFHRMIHLLARVRLRDLLVADLIASRGLAPTDVVAEVATSHLIRPDRRPGDLVAALAAVADIRPDKMVAAQREADRLIAEASGSPLSALAERGGIDGSIHREVAHQVAGGSRCMTDEGVPPRMELRMPDPARFIDFTLIGQGGMGLVYLAVDTQLQRVVALKLLRPPAGLARRGELEDPMSLRIDPASEEEQARLDRAIRRFLREVQVTGLLEHPGVVPVHEVGRTPGGIPYFTMRYVRGAHTLHDALLQAPHLGSHERLRLLEPFLKVCDTIAFAHDRGVVHRDLTPSNVALGDYGEVFVLDWGLATRRSGTSADPAGAVASSDAPTTPTNVGAGTPGYAAPEALFGDPSDVRGDVFSLCAILYEILVGRRAFPYGSLGEYRHALRQGQVPRAPHEEDHSVPRALSDLCMRGLSGNPDERPPSARELAAAVRLWQGGQLVDGEVTGFVRRSEAALGEARTLEGDELLRRLATAEAALGEIERRRPDHASLADHRARVAAFRAEEEARVRRGSRRLAVRWAAIAGVLAVAFLAAVLAWALR